MFDINVSPFTTSLQFNSLLGVADARKPANRNGRRLFWRAVGAWLRLGQSDCDRTQGVVQGLHKTDLERLRRRFSFLKASLFGVAVLAVTVFLTASPVIHDLRSGWALRFDGEDTTGQVTRLWHHGSGKNREMFVAYAFDVDGQRFSGENAVDDTLFWSLSNGDPIALRYGKDDPQLSAITIFGEHRGLRALALCVLLVVVLVLLLAALSSRIEAAYRVTYLRKAGVQRSAVVTRYVHAPGFSDGSVSSILWQDETGAAGQSWMMAATRLPGLGAKITVYADTEDKLSTIWDGEFGKP